VNMINGLLYIHVVLLLETPKIKINSCSGS